MENIKNKLLKIEEEFELLKKKIEKRHLFFILIYFSPPVLGILLFSRYFKELFGSFLKIIIFIIILFGITIHFFLRYKYYKSKSRYDSFILTKINELRKTNSKEDIIKSVKDILKEKNIKETDFWQLFLYNIDNQLN